MKTLLQINTVINSGSTGRIAEEIGELAMKRGWKSYIAYGRNDRQSRSERIAVGKRIDTLCHGLVTRLTDRHGFGSAGATRRLIGRIGEIKPDIIHLHNLHGYYLHIGLLFDYLAKSRIPVVWTLHDCWAMTGHCPHFQEIGCERWKTGCFDCPQTNRYPASLLRDASERNFADKKRLFTSVENLTLVPVCDWLRTIVGESFLHDHKVQMIRNGIDTSLFVPGRLPVPNPDRFRILAVASVWTPAKGLNDLYALSRMLEPDETLVLVGVTARQKKKLPAGVIGIERTESVAQLAALYAAAGATVTLTYQDTFPTVNIESMACGTPVVTYDTGGCAEAVDESTGYVVRPGDLRAVRMRLTEIKKRGKAGYVAACRDRAVRFYDQQERYREYVDLYESLLATGLKS